MPESSPPAYLVLKLRTLEPLPVPSRYGRTSLDGVVQPYFVVRATMAYDERLAAYKQLDLITLNLYGIIKDAVVISVTPAAPDAQPGVTVQVFTPKAPAEPAPEAPPLAPDLFSFRAAVDRGLRFPSLDFLFCSAN